MSFKAKFKAGNIEQNILNCSYYLMQEIDATGRPASIIKGGLIQVTVEGNASTELFEWMCNSFERKDGSVIFLKRDSDATLKELKFNEGYLVSFTEAFSSTTGEPLSVSFSISAREIKMGNNSISWDWV